MGGGDGKGNEEEELGGRDRERRGGEEEITSETGYMVSNGEV